VTLAEGQRLIAGGAFSGVLWFCLAITFDKGVRDLNVPVIPANGALETTASLFAALVTGITIAFSFRRAWLANTHWARWAAPLATLATGVFVFSILLRGVELAFGSPASSLGFRAIIDNLGLYALVSAFAPLLYGLAQLNRLAMRAWLRRAT